MLFFLPLKCRAAMWKSLRICLVTNSTAVLPRVAQPKAGHCWDLLAPPACCHPMSHGTFQPFAAPWPQCWLLVTHGASIKFTLNVHSSLCWHRSCVRRQWLGLAVLWAAAAQGSDVVFACCELHSIFPFLLLLCQGRGQQAGGCGAAIPRAACRQ